MCKKLNSHSIDPSVDCAQPPCVYVYLCACVCVYTQACVCRHGLPIQLLVMKGLSLQSNCQHKARVL